MANEQEAVKTIAEMAKAMGGEMGRAIQEAMALGAHQIRPNRDNPNYVPVSVFTPAGVVKEPLKRRTFFKGVEQDAALLTPEEVALLNQVVQGDYSIEVGGVPRTFTVREKTDGTHAEVKIDFPLSSEERAYMPAMTTILRAMIAGVGAIG